MNKKGAGVVAAVILTAIVTTMVCYIVFQLWIYNNTLTTGSMFGTLGNSSIDKVVASSKNGSTSDGNVKVPFDYATQFKMVALKQIIDQDYLYDYDEKEMADYIATGMVAALDDAYAEYFNEEDFNTFYTSTVGEFFGIGVYVTYDESRHMPIIIIPLEDSPAYEAGLKMADYIEYVDDVKSSNASYEEVVNAIKGLPGSFVKLGIIRKNKETGKEERIEFNIERRKVELNPVKSEVLENDIGYIELTSFDESSATKFKNAYDEIVNNKKVKALILDIRNNTGGVLDICKEITDVLVPEGKIVYSLDKKGNEEAVYSEADRINIPLVVLINNNSASASEVLAAAVKDYGVGTLVGETTYGKGVVQKLKPLKDGTYVKLTTAEYFSPKGNKINGVGVAPDIEVKLPEDIDNIYNIDKKDDTQLQKAIEILSK